MSQFEEHYWHIPPILNHLLGHYFWHFPLFETMPYLQAKQCSSLSVEEHKSQSTLLHKLWGVERISIVLEEEATDILLAAVKWRDIVDYETDKNSTSLRKRDLILLEERQILLLKIWLFSEFMLNCAWFVLEFEILISKQYE